MAFPRHRLRRLRGSANLRRMTRQTSLSVDNLAMPLFVVGGNGVSEPITSMPGTYHLSVDMLMKTCQEIAELEIPAVLLFGVPDHKDDEGSTAWADDGPVACAVRELKAKLPELVVITDVCLCAYTSHGHCGVLKDGVIDNDATLELLAKVALCHARAGADIVAPSDMMDGRVGAIRDALDQEGFTDVSILSYSTKYASAYYGPFREAADSTPESGDRRSHQMDPANAREGVREAIFDVEEGADMVMVKPALAYLDIIADVRKAVTVPVAAYNVSGEFSMLKAAAANGWIDEKAVVLETLVAMRRAGADIIFTYHAIDAARWLREPSA